jgi:hypothetical protein
MLVIGDLVRHLVPDRVLNLRVAENVTADLDQAAGGVIDSKPTLGRAEFHTHRVQLVLRQDVVCDGF